MTASKKIPQLLPVPSNGNVWIYGLFDNSSVCRYIGRTANPTSRAVAHKNSKRFSGFTFVVLEKAKLDDAYVRENHFIRLYRDKGHPLHNVKKPDSLTRPYRRHKRISVTFEMHQKIYDNLVKLPIAQKYGVSAALRDAVVDLILKHRSKQTTKGQQP